MTNQQQICAEALVAAVDFAHEIVSISRLNPAIVSALNTTATIKTMRVKLDILTRYVAMLEATSEPSAAKE